MNVPIPAFTLTKTASAVQVAPSGLVTWTITYKNYGTGTANSVNISDTLPPGFTWSACSNSCSHSGQSVSWTIGTVSAGATSSVTVTATAASPFTANNPATNTAVISWTGGTSVTATNEVGVTGNACSNYYFHSTTTSVGGGADGGTQKIANTTAPTNGTASTIPFHATTTPTFLASFFQDPPTPSDVNFSGNITTSFYVTKSSGPQLKMDVSVYDYELTGRELVERTI